MSAKSKENQTAQSLQAEGETEEYPLVYNLWITNLTITVEDGGTVIFQTGKPRENPPPPGGGG